MSEKPSGQCEYCGHIRYTNDLFNGACVPCVMWAEDQINKLTGDVARLQAELAKYTGPLTEAQVGRVIVTMLVVAEDIVAVDAAIRAAREGAR